jgi:hypothetical protein
MKADDEAALTGQNRKKTDDKVAGATSTSIDATPLAAIHSRNVVSFNFGWRHRLGLHQPPAHGGPPDPRSKGPGDDPAEAAVEYDARSWAQVHLPHDGLVALGASNISCPTGCSGRSFIPRHVMWYRKAFSLPPGWAGSDGDSSVWVEFDGVFHACIVYLNGAVVAQNAEGYLGFRVPLVNASSGRNVLAVFVDPDGGAGFSPLNSSGWWYEGQSDRHFLFAASHQSNAALLYRRRNLPPHPAGSGLVAAGR